MQVNGANQTKIHSVHGPQSTGGPHFRRGSQVEGGRPADQVEISPEAQEAARLAEAAAARAAERPGSSADTIRTGLVDRLRTEIASGSYDTADKLDAALDRLLDEIG